MQELLDKYVKSGMRLTDQRRLIIEEIAIATDHPNVETLYRRVNEKDSGISLATVYRAVTALEQAGLLERLDIRDGKARYEVAGSHHDHLIDEIGSVNTRRHDKVYYGIANLCNAVRDNASAGKNASAK